MYKQGLDLTRQLSFVLRTEPRYLVLQLRDLMSDYSFFVFGGYNGHIRVLELFKASLDLHELYMGKHMR